MNWFDQPCAPLSETARDAAFAHQQQLTKPAGSLGRLEQLALQFSAWQATARPQLDRIAVRVFAGDHGVCAQQVSAYPQQVTVQMVANFCAGGAAINVLCEASDADFKVINMGVVDPPLLAEMCAKTDHACKLIQVQLQPGTEDFSTAPAMSQATLEQALQAGADQVPDRAHLCIGGEMGIGNTTAAAALFAAVFSLSGADTAGRGTGVDDAGISVKQQVIDAALALHADSLNQPLQILRCLGGLEIAALTGFYIRSAQCGIPLMVDGYICSSAALMAMQINPTVSDWLMYSHCSAEQAHAQLLENMNAKPLLDLELRLGEGSGAALCIPLLQRALLLHNNMATFADAGVTNV